LLWNASGLAQQTSDPTEPIRSLEAALAGPPARPLNPVAVRAAVERAFDTDGIARAILAGLEGEASARKRERFRAALVGRIVRDTIRRRGGRRGTLRIVETRSVGPGEWLVRSELAVERRATERVNWRVRASGRSARIFDIHGRGSSMVRVLRGEYATAVRRLGLDAVTARIEARNRQAGG
jgi:ABC-type transporter MlaC component